MSVWNQFVMQGSWLNHRQENEYVSFVAQGTVTAEKKKKNGFNVGGVVEGKKENSRLIVAWQDVLRADVLRGCVGCRGCLHLRRNSHTSTGVHSERCVCKDRKQGRIRGLLSFRYSLGEFWDCTFFHHLALHRGTM